MSLEKKETRLERIQRVLEKGGIRTIENCCIEWDEKDFDLGRELRWLLTQADGLEKLVQKVETIVPYVTATIAPGNIIPAKDNPDWVEVHGGRLASSKNQLEHLVKFAQELK